MSGSVDYLDLEDLLAAVARPGTKRRLAWVATRLFAAMNNSVLRAPTVDEGEKFVVGVAAGTIELPEIVATLAAWGDWASL